MELSPTLQVSIQHKFDAFCKIILKHEQYDFYREIQRRRTYEVSFDELPENVTEQLSVSDQYSVDHYSFSVCGFDIQIDNERLGEAIAKLPEKKRNILLLHYFVGMNNKEISEALGYGRSSVSHQKLRALELLKKWMED